MTEFQTHLVLHALVERRLPPVVEDYVVGRVHESFGAYLQAVVWGEYGHLASCAAFEFDCVCHREYGAVVRNRFEDYVLEVEEPGVFHEQGCIAYGVVCAASCGSENMYGADVAYIAEDPSYGLGLVVVLLFALLYDNVRILLLQAGRKRIHVSNHQIRKPFLAEDRPAVSEKLGEGAVAADYEICRADEVARIFRLREQSVADYDDALTHFFLLSVKTCLVMSRKSAVRGIL